MRGYSLSRLSDSELTRGLTSLAAQARVTTSLLLAHIAEFDARRLYLPAAYPSMHAYCVGELKLSEDAAYKRITAARLARRFPDIFSAVASGRLNLTSLALLAPHLSPGNARGLLSASAGRTKLEVQELIASRFPRSECMELTETLSVAAAGQLAPERVESASSDGAAGYTSELAPERVDSIDLERGARVSSPLAPERGDRQSRSIPIAADRYLLQLTVGRATRDKLERARNLLAHRMPGVGASRVIDRALDVLIVQLERRKFAATARPRRGPASGGDSRHVPAQIRRAVWARDGGQCTFVSEAGRRCGARKLLEFDHAEPLARGGRATEANIRLRCRAHNQYAAELVYGADFMQRKREAAREPRRQRPSSAAASAGAASTRMSAAADAIVMALRNLGFSADEARRAAHYCHDDPDASLEIRLRRALCYLRPRASGVTATASS